MQVYVTILWQETISSIWILVLLLILILVLLSVIFIQRRRLSNCHHAIVRLIYEKEVLKKQLPPHSPYKYIPAVMTRSELLSIVSVINDLLTEFSGERVDDLEKKVMVSNDLLTGQGLYRKPSDDSVS